MKNVEILSHYTQFPVLLDILEREKIVLGNPASWDDKTDFRILEKYAEAKGKDIKVRALCLTKLPKGISDSVLHWKIYAPGKSGCRIDFDKEILEKIIKQSEATLERVDYLRTEELETQPEKWLKKTLFLKRSPYTYEYEWRILWFGKLNKGKEFELDIPEADFKNLIKRIKLSPALPKSLADSTRAFLEKHFKIKSIHSWLSADPNWERLAEKVFNLNHRR